MIGSNKWNVALGLFGFLLTFLLSVMHNEWLTSLIRGFYSSITLFVLTYGFRWLLGTVAGLKTWNAHSAQEHSEKAKEGGDEIGNLVDVTTPDDEWSLNHTLKMNLQSSGSHFSPLNPPKLASKHQLESEDLAKALRHLSEE